MNASDEVNAAGPASAQASMLRLVASAIKMGMMIVLVTVLLENSRWSAATPSTIRNGRRSGDTSPILPMSTSASHSAAPVRKTIIPSESPATMSKMPPQSTSP